MLWAYIPAGARVGHSSLKLELRWWSLVHALAPGAIHASVRAAAALVLVMLRPRTEPIAGTAVNIPTRVTPQLAWVTATTALSSGNSLGRAALLAGALVTPAQLSNPVAHLAQRKSPR